MLAIRSGINRECLQETFMGKIWSYPDSQLGSMLIYIEIFIIRPIYELL